MTTRTQIHTGIWAVLCGACALLHVFDQDYLRVGILLLAAWMPLSVRQKRTVLYIVPALVVLAVFAPKTALVLLALLWVGFLCLPKVPVPPTKSELTELKRAAERTGQTQDLGNIRVLPSGAQYVVDKHGSWRRVKAS